MFNLNKPVYEQYYYARVNKNKPAPTSNQMTLKQIKTIIAIIAMIAIVTMIAIETMKTLTKMTK